MHIERVQKKGAKKGAHKASVSFGFKANATRIYSDSMHP
nr:MAG TPA_asm: hypothetical protein [Caudoviricetes sp.]